MGEAIAAIGAWFVAYGAQAAAVVGAATGVAGTVIAATKDDPKMPNQQDGFGAVGAPKEDMLAQARAETRRKQAGAKGYNSTILSDITQQYGAAGGGLKEKTGQ